MPLTQQEKIFCDHLDYESVTCPSDPGLPMPASNWLKAHRCTQADIWNLLTLRRRERADVMGPKEPTELYAPAWKTGEEVKERNRELEGELQDAKALRPR